MPNMLDMVKQWNLLKTIALGVASIGVVAITGIALFQEFRETGEVGNLNQLVPPVQTALAAGQEILDAVMETSTTSTIIVIIPTGVLTTTMIETSTDDSINRIITTTMETSYSCEPSRRDHGEGKI